MAYLSNATFNKGMTGWNKINSAPNVSASVIQDGTAKSGSGFLRFRTSVADGSVGIDFPTRVNMTVFSNQSVPDQVIYQPPSIGVHAFVRARPGTPSVSGALTIWQLNLVANNNHPNSSFTVDGNWTVISNVIDIEPTNGPSPMLRIEFYLHSTNADLDIDSVWVA